MLAILALLAQTRQPDNGRPGTTETLIGREARINAEKAIQRARRLAELCMVEMKTGAFPRKERRA